MGKLRPHRPPQDLMQDSNKKHSLDRSLSFFTDVQLSQLPIDQETCHFMANPPDEVFISEQVNKIFHDNPTK